MRATKKKSPSYSADSKKLMQKSISAARDFVASWRLRAMARSSRRSKELSKEKSPNSHAAHRGSDTIRSLFQMDSKKLLLSCPQKLKTISVTAQRRFPNCKLDCRRSVE